MFKFMLSKKTDFHSKNVLSTGDNIVLVCGMSRSGTTLLTTVLDSHPQISCGAELMPGAIQSFAQMIKTLQAGLEAVGHDFSTIGRHLRQNGSRDAGLFLLRCHRAGLLPEEVFAALHELEKMYPAGALKLEQRLEVARNLIVRRSQRENTQVCGFKFTGPGIQTPLAQLPMAKLVCIVRDPFDVVLSHRKRKFAHSPLEIACNWKTVASKYRASAAAEPSRCQVVRYEDLVGQPRRTLQRVFNILPVEISEEIFQFYQSDSPIHAGLHPNAAQLKSDFSTASIGAGLRELEPNTIAEIREACGDEIETYGYSAAGHVKSYPATASLPLARITSEERAKKQQLFAAKRKFTESDYEALLDPYIGSHEILTLSEYAREKNIEGRSVLLIRHDVDHDLDTAIKIGRWEAERGIKSTFCLLHTAWYYGNLIGGVYQHSDFLVEGIKRLREFGHEINFHNNLVALALQTEVNPIDLLKSELDFFDSLGVSVTGTAMHGDGLCRQLGFRNKELFSESCEEAFGGPRIVSYQSKGVVRSCTLGAISMREFGLEYEAYDYGKDVYHTESGGRMRTRYNTKGRPDPRRANRQNSTLHGILTHPIWWNFK